MVTKTFEATTEITEGDDGSFTAVLSRITSETSKLPLVTLSGLTRAEINYKFDLSLAEPEKRPTEALAAAKSILREGIDKLPNSNLVSRTQAIDVFLDAMSELGLYEKDDEE